MTNDVIDYDPCPHGEHHPSLCVTCDGKKTERVVVYYTDGGECYHATPWCGSLAHGQEHVAERGGIPSHIKSGYLDKVRVDRRPCEGDCTLGDIPKGWGC